MTKFDKKIEYFPWDARSAFTTNCLGIIESINRSYSNLVSNDRAVTEKPAKKRDERNSP